MNYIHREKEELLELSKTSEQFRNEIKDMDRKAAYKHYLSRKGVLKYNTKETKDEFKKMNYERCSFCTGIIREFEREMTVEHIETKSSVPEKIYDWNNLLCSCRACNTVRSTTQYEADKYLDPTRVVDIERYFNYHADGSITAREELTEEESRAANYMIDLYGLNRETLICERRYFFNDLQDDDFYEGLLRKDLNSQRIIFRSVFMYFKKRRNSDGK